MSFSDFPPDAVPVRVLRQSLDRGRLAHAYLFTGEQPADLERLALALARTVNCLQPPTRNSTGDPVDSCGLCTACRRIQNLSHPDLRVLRPESKMRIISIDQVRDLIQQIHLKPSEARWKVAILTAADRLNPQAANAFLKTLEEPPSQSILILTSTEPDRLLDTILSRCLRLHLGSLGRHVFDPAHLQWVARFADEVARSAGNLLARYRLLGVLLEQLAEIKKSIETELTSRSPLETATDLDPKTRDRLETELAAAVEAAYRQRRGELLATLQWWLRDVWLVATLRESPLLALEDLAGPSRQIAARISPTQAADNIQTLERTQRLLHTNVQEALALEVGFLKLSL